MKIKGKVTILINVDHTKIEFHDEASGITFVEATLTPAQLSSALSRMGRTECESVIVRGLNNVGKQLSIREFVFEIPDTLYTQRFSKNYKDLIADYSQELLDTEEGGWISDKYFDSQGSVFMGTDNKPYAMCVARRWL